MKARAVSPDRAVTARSLGRSLFVSRADADRYIDIQPVGLGEPRRGRKRDDIQFALHVRQCVIQAPGCASGAVIGQALRAVELGKTAELRYSKACRAGLDARRLRSVLRRDPGHRVGVPRLLRALPQADDVDPHRGQELDQGVESDGDHQSRALPLRPSGTRWLRVHALLRPGEHRASLPGLVLLRSAD